VFENKVMAISAALEDKISRQRKLHNNELQDKISFGKPQVKRTF
jgi:hypothetical protein